VAIKITLFVIALLVVFWLVHHVFMR